MAVGVGQGAGIQYAKAPEGEKGYEGGSGKGNDLGEPPQQHPQGAAQDYTLLVRPSQGPVQGLGSEKEQRAGEEDGGLSDIWGHGMGLSYAESKQSKGN